MFPGPGAQIYRNEEGEILGWDYPPDPNDPGEIQDDLDREDADWNDEWDEDDE